MVAFYCSQMLKLRLAGQGDRLAWALMPSGQNGLRTAEFEMSFKQGTRHIDRSLPIVLRVPNFSERRTLTCPDIRHS
jgi:hypothetical protein